MHRLRLLVPASLLAVSAASAASLGLTQSPPLLAGDNSGVTKYVAATQTFTVTSRPAALLEDGILPPRFILPDTGSGAQSIALTVIVDNAGNYVSGVIGDDFVVIGGVDFTGDFVADTSGVLLTGEVKAFGYRDEGTTDTFDFRIEVTGGLLAPLYAGKDIALVNAAENSTFTGSFLADFGGQGKITLGATDPLPSGSGDPPPLPECVEQAAEAALSLPGIARDLQFVPGTGRVTEVDGDLLLTGSLVSASRPGRTFDVQIVLGGRTSVAGAGSPVLGLDPAAYVSGGGTIDPSTWVYYEEFYGVLTGTGHLEGVVVQLTRRGPAVQVGAGASGQSTGLGGAGWLDYEIVEGSRQRRERCGDRTGQGELSVNFVDCAPVEYDPTGICGVAFEDENGNGVRDEGEPGLAGVEVSIRTGRCDWQTVVTGEDGVFTFADLAADSYFLVADERSGGLKAERDDRWRCVTVEEGACTPVAIPYRSGRTCVTGTIFHDHDRDGRCGRLEGRFHGCKVELTDSQGRKRICRTDEHGRYKFDDVPSGWCRVRVVAEDCERERRFRCDEDEKSFTVGRGDASKRCDFRYRDREHDRGRGC